MKDNILWAIQSMTIEQLKNEIDSNRFVDKKLKDFENGKKSIDEFTEINKMDQDVQYALIMYAIYKIKGGK